MSVKRFLTLVMVVLVAMGSNFATMAFAQGNDISNQVKEIRKALEELDKKFNSLANEKKELQDKLEFLESANLQDEEKSLSDSPNASNAAADEEDASSEVSRSAVEDKSKEPKISAEKITSASLDLAIPESPAFAVLGLSPQEVIRPTTPRDFAAGLLNGIDKNGNFQSGVAIDTVPYLLFNGENTSLAEYRERGNYAIRLLTNTQLSVATAKGSSDDDKSVKLAAGLKIVPWNRGDPRTFKRLRDKREIGKEGKEYWLEECFERASSDSSIELVREERRKKLGEKLSLRFECNARKCDEREEESDRQSCKDDLKYGDECDETLEAEYEGIEKKADLFLSQIGEKLKPLAEQCREDLKKLTWNNSALTFGAAPTWISTDGEVGNVEWNGLGAWASLAYGFEEVPGLENTSQFIIHGRYRTDEEVPIEGMEGMFMNRDSVFVGSRLIVGKPDLAAQLEGGYTFSDPDDGDNENSFLFSVGGNIKIRDNLWLDLAIGGKSSDSNSDSQVFVLNALRWGFQSEPTIVPAASNP